MREPHAKGDASAREGGEGGGRKKEGNERKEKEKAKFYLLHKACC